MIPVHVQQQGGAPGAPERDAQKAYPVWIRARNTKSVDWIRLAPHCARDDSSVKNRQMGCQLFTAWGLRNFGGLPSIQG